MKSLEPKVCERQRIDVPQGFFTFRICTFKARAHGAFFFCAFAMQKMDCVVVNDTVHTVQFLVRVMHWCVRCRTRLGCTPILCDCDCVFWNHCNWYL